MSSSRSSSPKPKRSKYSNNFYIENILNPFFHNSQEIPQISPNFGINQHGTGISNPEKYVEQLENISLHNPKFQLFKKRIKFQIKDLPADPEGLLAGIFQYCIDEAVDQSDHEGVNPLKLGCIISSELLDPDVWIPVREMNDNTVDAILNRFLQVGQSKKQQDITLWGKPFTVTLTTVDRSALPEKRKITGGSSRNRKLAPVHHRIDSQCLIKINNSSNYCLFYALQASLMDKIKKWPRWKYFDYIHNRKGQKGELQKNTEMLMRKVGAPTRLKDYDAEIWVPKIVEYWNNFLFTGQFIFKVYIFGSSGHYKPLFKFGPEEFNIPIVLYYNNKHFDGVQKIGGLFGQPYCLSCEKIYNRSQNHSIKCRSRCPKCSQVGIGFPCKSKDNYNKKCIGCNKIFDNYNCYNHHMISSFCNNSKQCDKCGEIWNVYDNKRNGRSGHICLEKYCGRCGDFHDPKRGCFIRILNPKRQLPYRLISFDLETTQYKKVNSVSPDKRIHEPNFIAAKVACPDCIINGEWRKSLKKYNCKVCGQNRLITFSQQPFNKTRVDKQVIDKDPLKAFVHWLLYKLPKDYDTVAYSHFGGRFDMVIVASQLYSEGINPQVLMKGNKLYEMKIMKRPNYNSNIIFRDSFNLMPMALAALVPTFGLDIDDKPFFPHLANRPENYGKKIYLSKEDYMASGMMPTKRKEFDAWFEKNKENLFLLDEALASYCTNDVEILMCALVAFRNEFFETTKRSNHEGIDVLKECMTIASACMKHYRTNHLKEKHLSIVPERGYENVDNQSLLALKFLKWYSEKNNIKIQTAHSVGGEKKVGNFKLDGWVEERNLGIEVNGCAWHGCPKKSCYPDDNMMLPNGMTAGKRRLKDYERKKFILEQGIDLKIFWECEIREMLENDRDMKEKFNNYLDEGPLEIRACFFGGRTGPLKLIHEARPGEKISYFDVTSLYPFTNFNTNYPIGHPIVHTLNEEVHWTCAADNPYKLALLKVFVIPPKKIDIPVLPAKFDEERLLFPLCAECSKLNPKGNIIENYSCTHTERQRGWVSSCTSIELNAALEEGYIVKKVYRVLEYTKSDNELFRPYMREFLAQKIHATGFDDKIKGNAIEEEKFVKECWEKFGMKIEREKMIPNKGKRAIAKLAVNNLWGRFSLRNQGLTQTYITDDPSELADFLDNRSIEMVSIDELTKEAIMLRYLKKKEWIEEHECSNVVISLWTTSAARLHLLRLMQKVARTSDCTLLYTDTDSLIFSHPEDNNPLELGPHLGDLTDEYPNHEILEYCSGGAKQYGLKLKRKCVNNEEPEYVLKVRGITLNYDVINNQGLRYQTFKNSILQYVQTCNPISIPLIYPNFLRPSVKKGCVISQPLTKIYKPFVGKGIIRPSDFSVLDFGFVKNLSL
uniref:DNA-directed DNA polymerase n=1 Tax=Meloidogyne enterolobii TaxID=390850 RepID=A0A6V7U129_MELEN|nr:unnamed protein product [Meloidogyne enterolobii]